MKACFSNRSLTRCTYTYTYTCKQAHNTHRKTHKHRHTYIYMVYLESSFSYLHGCLKSMEVSFIYFFSAFYAVFNIFIYIHKSKFLQLKFGYLQRLLMTINYFCYFYHLAVFIIGQHISKNIFLHLYHFRHIYQFMFTTKYLDLF